MSDDAQPIEGESRKWFSKYLLYRNMKAEKRSLLGAYIIYQEQASKGLKKPYKHVPGAWKQAFEKWNWQSRSEAYDAHLQAEQEERTKILRDIEAAEIENIMSTGYATIHRRIEALSRMADLIKLSFMTHDEKSDEDKIEFKWVTPEKIREFRGCMEDIAKELGHRVTKKEITGKDGGPIQIQRNPDLSTLSDEELATLLRLEQAAIERAG